MPRVSLSSRPNKGSDPISSVMGTEDLVVIPTLKELLFKALNEAYPNGQVTISDYQPGHSKLAARRLVHAHVGVRVAFTPEETPAYAIAGMLPATATDKDVTELMARLADDKRRAETSAIPAKVV